MKFNPPIEIETVAQMHEVLGVRKPVHPLVSVVKLETVICNPELIGKAMMYGFYDIALKKNFDARLRYGRQHYDFDQGVMTFLSPRQVFSIETESMQQMDGYMLLIHPDFLKWHALASELPAYHFFSYAVNEALHVSEEEDQMISGIMDNLDREITARPDAFSQELILSQISLLLQYCNRFYTRQFLTRKPVIQDTVARFEELLREYFASSAPRDSGLPSVHYFSDKLNLSPDYLSELLRNLTGRNTRQHIQDFVVEKTKELLSTTNLTVSEIAFSVGFEHPQSLSKLFRARMEVTPGKYRMGFN